MFARVAADLRENPSRWALAFLFVLALFPSLDLALSALFYRPGVGFTWSADGFLEFVRRAVPDMVLASFVLCAGLWLAGLAGLTARWRLATPPMAYLLLTLAAGPGLIVETVLKPFWGRARPKDITMFGGDAVYTLPWQIADQCSKNCSFVSGHAAIAFWVTAYAFLLPQRWRAAGVAAGILFGFGVGFVRIAQGAHFFSDIAAAGLIVFGINYLAARFMLFRHGNS